MVLDNARNADQVRPLLPGGPGCLVLVTSRDRLSGLVARDGATRVDLDALPAGEAQDLLGRLLARHGLAAEHRSLADLAHACGHLPLALRIAAAHLVDAPGGIARLIADLRGDDRLAALDIDGDPQASVRAAFDLSYRALPPDARRMFRLVGLVPGPDVVPEAAAALFDTDRAPWRRAAGPAGDGPPAHRTRPRPVRAARPDPRLRRPNCSPPRIWKPSGRPPRTGCTTTTSRSSTPPPRQLYPDRLRLPVPASLDRRHGRAFADRQAALDWLDAEHANLTAAIGAAARTGPYPAAFRLADQLRGYLIMWRHSGDWLAVSSAGLVAAQAAGDLDGQAVGVPEPRRRRPRPEPVRRGARALPARARPGGADRVAQAQAGVLGNMSVTLSQCGRLAEAAANLDAALAIDRRTGGSPAYAGRLANLGGIYHDLGDLRRALVCRQEALVQARRHGASYPEAIVLDNLGVTLHELGRLDEAVENLSAALALHRASGNRSQEADTLRCLAAVHFDAGRDAQTREVVDAVLALAAEINDRRVEAEARNTQAALLARGGDASGGGAGVRPRAGHRARGRRAVGGDLRAARPGPGAGDPRRHRRRAARRGGGGQAWPAPTGTGCTRVTRSWRPRWSGSRPTRPGPRSTWRTAPSPCTRRPATSSARRAPSWWPAAPGTASAGSRPRGPTGSGPARSSTASAPACPRPLTCGY